MFWPKLKRHYCLSLLMVGLAAIACTNSPGDSATARALQREEVGPDVERGNGPADPAESSSSDAEPDSSSPGADCEGRNWNVVPTDVFEFPIEEGWKRVVVDLAIENASSYWGRITIDPTQGSALLTTEGGFSYQAEAGNLRIPAELSTEYSGLNLRANQPINAPYLPPGFRASGYSERNLDPFLLSFRVAETQTTYTLTLESVSVDCLLAGPESVTQTIPPVSLDLAKDVRTLSYPSDRPQSEFSGFLAPLYVADVGEFRFTDIRRKQDGGAYDLELHFLISNESQGYEISGHVGRDAYIIGDDGVVQRPQVAEGRFSAGPAQIVDSTMGFTAGSDTRNMKLVIPRITAGGRFFNVLRIANLPEIPPPAVQIPPTETIEPGLEFTLTSFSGTQYLVSDYIDNVVVLYFWGSWCGPTCETVASDLERIWRENQPRSLIVLGVNSQDTDTAALAWLDRLGITYPNGPDPDNKIGKLLRVRGFPSVVFLDKNGHIYESFLGSTSYDQLNAVMEPLLED